ncbi:MAG: DUF2188 domain-containing protein [Acholeplasmatales bacterium]|nr:DUF2188 domain-containing protein [Acholeplasmatales bacterium]
MKNTIIARPCKEKPGEWEIQDQNGNVNNHYNSKDECISCARKMAQESGCELRVENSLCQ